MANRQAVPWNCRADRQPAVYENCVEGFMAG